MRGECDKQLDKLEQSKNNGPGSEGHQDGEPQVASKGHHSSVKRVPEGEEWVTSSKEDLKGIFRRQLLTTAGLAKGGLITFRRDESIWVYLAKGILLISLTFVFLEEPM